MSVTTLQGMNVVVTGVVPNYDRPGAERLLAQHGAHIQKNVVKTTDILVFGAKVGRTKTDKATALGVACIPWSDAMDLMSGAPVQPTAPPEAPTKMNQRVEPQAGYTQVQPMLCKKPDGDTPEEQLPSGSGWIYEPKWDGYRCIAHVNGRTILQSRGGTDYARYTHIIEELDRLTVSCVLDGELCVLDEEGNASLERLHDGEIDTVKYVVFDILELQGQDLRLVPFTQRRELLSGVLTGGMHITESPMFTHEERDALLAHMRATGNEGIVCKPANSIYKEKARGPWLKIKIRPQQEFVIVGYTAGKGNRSGTAGAFLLAVNAGNKRSPKWQYVGDVGTGGTLEFIRMLTDSLTEADDLSKDLAGLELGGRGQKDVEAWVKPDTVIDVKFQRWTDDGKLFHPSIQGIRTDKQPKEVVRET